MQTRLMCLFVASCCWAQNTPPLDHPLPFEWPVDGQQAAMLQKTLTAKSVADDILNNGDEIALPVSVQTFAFAELERNKIYLVASVDASGRGLFYGTDIVYCSSPESCSADSIYDAPPHNYSEELVDLDGNGVKAIVSKSLAGTYEGAQSVDIFIYKIYKVIDGKAVDVSAQYKSYYDSTLLPKMKADLARARAEYPEEDAKPIVEALGTIAQDDYARRILKQPAAGLEHAKTWAHSGNHRLEDYALNTLRQIDDPAADAVLAELSKSDDERMSSAAAREIEIRQSVRKDRQLRQSMHSQKQ